MRVNNRSKTIPVHAASTPSPASFSVPRENVVDLRTVMAKKELVRMQRTHEHITSSSRPSFWERFAAPGKTASEHAPVIAHETPPVDDVQDSQQHSGGTSMFEEAGAPRSAFAFASLAKALFTFAIVASFLSLPAVVRAMLHKSTPTRDAIVEESEDAFLHLQRAGEKMQQYAFSDALNEFQSARTSFQEVSRRLDALNQTLLTLARFFPWTSTTVTTGERLVVAGDELAQAGVHIAEALATLQEQGVAVPPTSATDEDLFVTETAPTITPTDLLVILHSTLAPARENIHRAARAIVEVDVDVVPQSYQSTVQQAKAQLPALAETVDDGVALTELLLILLGHEEEKRYLVLFQNNHELRPTGGFIGSLALLDVRDGVITGFDAPSGGVYDVSGQLTKIIEAPTPLRLVNPHWSLQDANWFPHFPASAQKIQWFYEQSGGPSVDGVITFVPSVVEDLLRISGPIDLSEEFNVVITAENFYTEVQTRAEEKFDATRESKKIIGVLLPRLLNTITEQLREPADIIAILDVLQQALTKKNILLFMNDPTLQRSLSERHWSGELRATDRDYLAVVHTNIAGGKTDVVIDNTIRHAAVVDAQGVVTDTLTITRVHKGILGDPFTGVDNTDYLRVYVPQGSTILSVKGFATPALSLFLEPDGQALRDPDYVALSGDILYNEQTDAWENVEFGKTVIGGWVRTPVGASTTIEIVYRLPFRLAVGGFFNKTDYYSLLVQQQPGVQGTRFESTVTLPPTIHMMRAYPEIFRGTTDILLNNDYYSGMILAEGEK